MLNIKKNSNQRYKWSNGKNELGEEKTQTRVHADL